MTEEDLELERKRQIRRQKILETVKKVTNVARDGLDIYFHMKSKNPLSIGLGILSAYGTVSENFFPAKVEAGSILHDMGAEIRYRPAADFILDTIKRLGISKRILWTESGESSTSIEEYVFSESSIYFVRYDNNYVEGPYIKDVELFRKEMTIAIARKLGKYILLDTVGDEHGWNRNMSLVSISPCKDPYVSIFDENKLISNINKFFDKDLNRSMLFYGPPGSGKTTLALRLTEALEGSILILNGWSLSHKPTGSILNAIRMVDPVVILFDDLDRIHDMENLLSDLESLNRERTGRNRLFIATVNDMRRVPKALRRPGRFDQSIEFVPPEKDLAKEILKVHADSLNLGLTDEELEELAELSEGMTGAFLREIAIRTGILGMEDMSVYIENMKKVSSFSDRDDEEEADKPGTTDEAENVETLPV
jgi:hypothetical protein